MWVKLDDQFFSHPKVIDLNKEAKLLYLAGLTYCGANLTDGLLSRSSLRVVAALVDVSPKLSQDLVEAGLWVEDEAGFRVHDFLKYNPAAARVKATRENTKERVEEWRAQRGKQKGGNKPGNTVSDTDCNIDCNGVTIDVTNGVSNADCNAQSNSVGNTCPVYDPSTIRETPVILGVDSQSKARESRVGKRDALPPLPRRSTEVTEDQIAAYKGVVPPPAIVVAAYARLRNWPTGESRSFYDHHETAGWIPKGQTRMMKSWQAAMRTWESKPWFGTSKAKPETEDGEPAPRAPTEQKPIDQMSIDELKAAGHIVKLRVPADIKTQLPGEM